MRGVRTSISKTRADVVLVSVRYEESGNRLQFARGYARRGQVWGDIQLFDRTQLVESLKNGLNIFTGQSASLAGDFEVLSPVELSADERIVTEDSQESSRDSLDLPIL